MAVKRVRSSSPAEEAFGACHALRVGTTVIVGATAALDPEGRALYPGDAGAQAHAVIEAVRSALARAGASPDRVVQTRVYLSRAEDAPAVAAAHAEAFGAHRPVTSVLLVAGFPVPGVLVEVEATAVLREGPEEEDGGAYIRRSSRAPGSDAVENPFNAFRGRGRSPPSGP